MKAGRYQYLFDGVPGKNQVHLAMSIPVRYLL